MNITLDDAKTKELFKAVMVELLQERRDLFQEMMVEALEEIAFANAIKEGRQNNFASEEGIFSLLNG